MIKQPSNCSFILDGITEVLNSVLISIPGNEGEEK